MLLHEADSYYMMPNTSVSSIEWIILLSFYIYTFMDHWFSPLSFSSSLSLNSSVPRCVSLCFVKHVFLLSGDDFIVNLVIVSKDRRFEYAIGKKNSHFSKNSYVSWYMRGYINFFNQQLFSNFRLWSSTVLFSQIEYLIQWFLFRWNILYIFLWGALSY